MATKQKKSGTHTQKRGRRKGQQTLGIAPTEPLGSKLAKTIAGEDWDAVELQLVQSVHTAESEYHKHTWLAVMRDITTPHPTKATSRAPSSKTWCGR